MEPQVSITDPSLIPAGNYSCHLLAVDFPTSYKVMLELFFLLKMFKNDFS